MKKQIHCISLIIITLFSSGAFATNLMDVYRKALESDPAFKAANSQWLATKEGVPIARSYLFPQISATGGLARSYNQARVGNGEVSGDNGNFYNNNANYSLTLTQSIFNFGNASSLSNAQATAKSAAATFAGAAQDLMFRTANNYFNVLLNNDILRVTQEKKKAIAEQLRQTKQKYDVGLIPITDLNDAQASYDTVVSDEISAKKDLEDSKEKLREITAIRYQQLDGIGDEVPLVTPQPANMEQWVRTAENQNNSLLAARFTTVAARINISTQFAGHLPTLDLNGSYGYTYNSNSQGDETFSKLKETQGGVTFNLPIFQGGQVSAQTSQANYQYQNAIHTQEQTHRTVNSNTRQSYLGVISGISKIIADRQAIVSKASKLRSTQLSYDAGLRTMVDVLNAETDLYDAQKTYYQDQYSYIIETVNLKQLAGTLNSHDLMLINRWLKRANVNLNSDINTAKISSRTINAYSKESIPPGNNTAIPFKDKTSDSMSAEKVEDKAEQIENKQPKPTAQPTTQNLSPDEQHLLSMNKNHYTILLLAKDDTKIIDKFIKNNGLANQAFYYYATDENDNDIYKLVYGDYKNQETATKWLHKLALSSGSKDSDFKVIKYQDVQDEIKTNN